MKNYAKTLLKKAIAKTPYTISRKPSNVFDAIDEGLEGLSRNGFKPDLIVDGGAHLGSFALTASALFPRAKIHMFEPQPACIPALRSLAAQRGFDLSPAGLGARKSTARLRVEDRPSTGSSIAPESGSDTTEIAITTIDDTFADKFIPNNSFLKLDIQGYELEALKGAEKTLSRFEIILSEVSFYAQAYEPSPRELIAYLDDRGFRLTSIFALIARPRDGRLRQGDFLFARHDSPFVTDTRWD